MGTAVKICLILAVVITLSPLHCTRGLKGLLLFSKTFTSFSFENFFQLKMLRLPSDVRQD